MFVACLKIYPKYKIIVPPSGILSPDACSWSITVLTSPMYKYL